MLMKETEGDFMGKNRGRNPFREIQWRLDERKESRSGGTMEKALVRRRDLVRLANGAWRSGTDGSEVFDLLND
jgi:hypothetical protein